MKNKYSNPFLQQVIIKINFAEPNSLLEVSIPSDLEEIIKKHFPISDSREITKGEVKISIHATEGQVVEREDRKVMEWRFREKNNAVVLAIDSETLDIVFNRYEDFEAVKIVFKDIIQALFSSYPNMEVKRLGLRYINNINIDESNPISWTKYLNSHLLSIFKIPFEKEKIARAFHSLFLNYGDYKLHFQYGMHNPDFPAIIKQKSFILDFDAYSESLVDNERQLQIYLNTFHDKIEELYENSIKDPLRSIMGVVRNEG